MSNFVPVSLAVPASVAVGAAQAVNPRSPLMLGATITP